MEDSKDTNLDVGDVGKQPEPAKEGDGRIGQIGVPPKINPAPCAQNEACPHQHSNPWWKRGSSWKTLLELSAFAVGVYAVFVYHGQLCESRNARTLQAEVDKPLIGTFDVKHVQHGNLHFIRQWWKNYGTSQPTNLRIEWNYFVDLPPRFTVGDHPKVLIRDASNINSGDYSDDLTLTPEDRAKAKVVDHMFLLGRITYGDTFAPDISKPHEVHYCGQLRWIKLDPGDGWSWNDVLACPSVTKDFDCMDKECETHSK